MTMLMRMRREFDMSHFCWWNGIYLFRWTALNCQIWILQLWFVNSILFVNLLLGFFLLETYKFLAKFKVRCLRWPKYVNVVVPCMLYIETFLACDPSKNLIKLHGFGHLMISRQRTKKVRKIQQCSRLLVKWFTDIINWNAVLSAPRKIEKLFAFVGCWAVIYAVQMTTVPLLSFIRHRF